MPATRTSEFAKSIIKLCSSPEGRSTKEIAELLGRKQNSASVYMAELKRAGILFRGGADKTYRFFTDPVAAAEYEKQAKEALKKQMEATAQRIREAAAARGRKERAEKRKEQGLAPYERKPKKIDLTARDSGLVIATKQQEIDHKRFHAQANVIWPEGVKITIIPTGVDTRFVAFVEPGKGQISQDQRARWKQERRVNT
jgi:predicted transcriptional regulator